MLKRYPGVILKCATSIRQTPSLTGTQISFKTAIGQ